MLTRLVLIATLEVFLREVRHRTSKRRTLRRSDWPRRCSQVYLWRSAASWRSVDAQSHNRLRQLARVMSSAVGSLPPRRRIGLLCVRSTECPLFWCFAVARFHPSRNSQTFPIRHSSRLSARTMRLDTLVRLSPPRPVTGGNATGATQNCLDWTTMASTVSSLKRDRLSGTGTAVVGWNWTVRTDGCCGLTCAAPDGVRL